MYFMLPILKIVGISYSSLLFISIMLSTCLFIYQDKNVESQDISKVDYVSMTLLSPFFMTHKSILFVHDHWIDILEFLWRNIIVRPIRFIWDWIIYPILNQICRFLKETLIFIWNNIIHPIIRFVEDLLRRIHSLCEYLWKQFCILLEFVLERFLNVIEYLLRRLRSLYEYLWKQFCILLERFIKFVRNFLWDQIVRFYNVIIKPIDNTLIWLWNNIYHYILYPIYSLCCKLYSQCSYLYNLLNGFLMRIWNRFWVIYNRVITKMYQLYYQFTGKFYQLYEMTVNQYSHRELSLRDYQAYDKFLNLWNQMW